MIGNAENVAILIDCFDDSEEEKVFGSHALVRQKVFHDDSGTFPVSGPNIRIARFGDIFIESKKLADDDVFAVNPASKLAFDLCIRREQFTEISHGQRGPAAAVLVERREQLRRPIAAGQLMHSLQELSSREITIEIVAFAAATVRFKVETDFS